MSVLWSGMPIPGANPTDDQAAADCGLAPALGEFPILHPSRQGSIAMGNVDEGPTRSRMLILTELKGEQ